MPHFNIAIEFIHSAIKKGGRVLVHCAMGQSRSLPVSQCVFVFPSSDSRYCGGFCPPCACCSRAALPNLAPTRSLCAGLPALSSRTSWPPSKWTRTRRPSAFAVPLSAGSVENVDTCTFRYVRRRKGDIKPNPGFQKELKEYEKVSSARSKVALNFFFAR